MSAPIGDPRQSGKEGPAGDQRKAGESSPAGDPREAGQAELKAETKASESKPKPAKKAAAKRS